MTCREWTGTRRHAFGQAGAAIPVRAWASPTGCWSHLKNLDYVTTGTATLSVGTEYLDRYAAGTLGTGKRPLSAVPEVKVSVPIQVEYEVSPSVAEPTARLRNQVAAMFCTEDAPILQLSPRAASVGLFARPCAPEMELRFEVRWLYGDSATTLGKGELRWTKAGNTSRFMEQHRTSTGQRGGEFALMHVRGPVSRGGTATGTLVLEFTEVIIGGRAATEADIPFTVELGPIRIEQ